MIQSTFLEAVNLLLVLHHTCNDLYIVPILFSHDTSHHCGPNYLNALQQNRVWGVIQLLLIVMNPMLEVQIAALYTLGPHQNPGVPLKVFQMPPQPELQLRVQTDP